MIWLLYFCTLFFLIGCGYCPEHNKEAIYIISNVEIDSIDSKIFFPERNNELPLKIRSSQIDMGDGPIQMKLFAGNDSLSYSLAIKNMVNIYIVIDSLPAESCSSVYGGFSTEGFGHYRINSGRLYSCVFYYEPECI